LPEIPFKKIYVRWENSGEPQMRREAVLVMRLEVELSDAPVG
jgi:hypothetical protein